MFLFPLIWGTNGFMARLAASPSAAGVRAAALIQPGPGPSRPCRAVGSEPSRLAAPAWGHWRPEGQTGATFLHQEGRGVHGGRAWTRQKCAVHRGPPSPPGRRASEPGLGPRACPKTWAHSMAMTPVWGPQSTAQLQSGRWKPPGPTPARQGLQRARPRVAGVGTSTEPLGTPSPEGAAGTAQPHLGPSGSPPRCRPQEGGPWGLLEVHLACS